GGADAILLPERPFDIDEVAETLKRRHARGRYFSVVVAAEGARFRSDVDPAHGAAFVSDMAKDEFGHARLGGIGNVLAREIERRTGFETRAVVLGHIERGGPPTAFYRRLATRYGIGATAMVHTGASGCMVARTRRRMGSGPVS